MLAMNKNRKLMSTKMNQEPLKTHALQHLLQAILTHLSISMRIKEISLKLFALERRKTQNKKRERKIFFATTFLLSEH